MGRLAVQLSCRGADCRAELGMVNLVCVVTLSRYRAHGSECPADRRPLTGAAAYVSQMTRGP
jgi:hypothetical protein